MGNSPPLKSTKKLTSVGIGIQRFIWFWFFKNGRIIWMLKSWPSYFSFASRKIKYFLSIQSLRELRPIQSKKSIYFKQPDAAFWLASRDTEMSFLGVLEGHSGTSVLWSEICRNNGFGSAVGRNGALVSFSRSVDKAHSPTLVLSVPWGSSSPSPSPSLVR